MSQPPHGEQERRSAELEQRRSAAAMRQPPHEFDTFDADEPSYRVPAAQSRPSWGTILALSIIVLAMFCQLCSWALPSIFLSR